MERRWLCHKSGRPAMGGGFFVVLDAEGRIGCVKLVVKIGSGVLG